MSKILEVRNLDAGYGTKLVLSGAEFSVNAGEILAIIGPNGAGKSTIIKTIAGFQPKLGGEVLVAGRELNGMSPIDRARIVSIVMTRQPNVEWQTVREVVATGRYPYTGRFGKLSEYDWDKVDEAMEMLEVSEIANSYFAELSDGQRQRVMIAKSIAQEPELLILDEPTSFLDIKYQLEFVAIAKKLAKEHNIAIFMSLHELNLVKKVADNVVTLKNGKVDAYGAAEDIMKAEYIEALYGINKGGLSEF